MNLVREWSYIWSRHRSAPAWAHPRENTVNLMSSVRVDGRWRKRSRRPWRTCTARRPNLSLDRPLTLPGSAPPPRDRILGASATGVVASSTGRDQDWGLSPGFLRVSPLGEKRVLGRRWSFGVLEFWMLWRSIVCSKSRCFGIRRCTRKYADEGQQDGDRHL
jgi:hypothetical protein